MRWFRFYDDAVNDPKVQRLSPEMFKTWVNLLCIASKHDGVLPSLADLAFTMRVSESQLESRLEYLSKVGLLDDGETGMSPHNWNGRQYHSDSSAERVRRFRKRQRNADVTAGETLQKQKSNAPDTETDTETESSRGNERKTRIPPNFAPEEKYTLRALDELGYSPQAVTDELHTFIDHFTSRTGPKTLHSNWQITFWNWLKRSKKFGQDRKHSRGSSIERSFAEVDAAIDRHFPPGEDAGSEGSGGTVVEIIPRLRQSH